MAAVLGDCLPSAVVCSSSWLCQGDLAAVLSVADPDTAAVRETAPSREDCVLLEAPSPAEVVPPCALSLICVAQGKDRLLNVSVYSEARTIEVYSESQDGQVEEYMGTSRGEKFCNLESSQEDRPVTLYKAHLKLDFPVPSCRVKLLSLGGRNSVFVSQITVQVTSVPERCSQSPSLLCPSIDMERVQSIMDSMGGKMSPGAEDLMNMMRAQQKHQAPFSASLLQLFGSFQHGRGQNTQTVGQLTQQANTTDTKAEIPHSKPSQTQPVQQPSAPERDMRSIMSSLLQNPTGQASSSPTPDSLLPLFRDLCSKKKPSAESRQESCVTPGEGKLDPSLEKLLSVHLERAERNLRDHIDHRMKALQKHLDTRLDHIVTLIQSGNSNALSGKTPEKIVNGQTNGGSEQDCDLDVF